MRPLLGGIGDDFTGSTDLGDTLVRQGMRVIQTTGVPAEGLALPEADAVVVSLKCRSIEAAEAVAQCRAALGWLRSIGCRQFYYKYSSTFDSTERGNIGPIAKALLSDLGGRVAVFCPAYPGNLRTVYKGRIFVGDVPLDESPMRDHPLTPMRNANILRLLEVQSGERVGLVAWETVRRGAGAVRRAFDDLAGRGVRFAVTDAIEDVDLFTIGEACADLPLVTGGSGMAMGLPENFRRAGLLARRDHAECPPDVSGGTAILSGSCSEATRGQLEAFRAHGLPMLRLDPLFLAEGPRHIAETLARLAEGLARGPVLAYSSETPGTVAEVQARLGRERSGALVEGAMGSLAVALRALGVRRFIVAGGETAGAVVKSLGVAGLCIGPRIAPGVPWTVAIGAEPVALALKSGNFGGPGFFADALDMLPWPDGGWR